MLLFGRPVTAGEFIMGILTIVGFVLAIIGNVTNSARNPTLIVIAATAGVLLLALMFALARPTYVVVGYKNVMDLLEQFARSAKHSLWTARTHQGPADLEQRYFDIIRERVIAAEDPLEDFRRVVRIGVRTENAEHLLWLARAFADQPAAKIRVYEGGGPPFDFVVIDKKTAVIGFPQSGGVDNSSAIVVRGRNAVAGIEAVFDALFGESTVFFTGKRHITDLERAGLIDLASKLIDHGTGASLVVRTER